MFDIVGKRRWFFLFSALITIPGLFFILLTPLTGGQAGLQFSIDYTGGTALGRSGSRTETSPPTRSSAGPRRARGLEDSTVVKTADGFFDIRTEPIGLADAAPDADPTPSTAPSGSPGASPPAASPRARRRRPRRVRRLPRAASPSASPSPRQPSAGRRQPEPVGVAAAVGRRPRPHRRPSRRRQHDLPTEGELGEVAAALQDEFGPIAEQQTLTIIGPVVSVRPDPPGAPADPRRLARHPGLDHVPVPRREVRRDRARRAAPRRHRGRRASSRSSGRSSASRSTACSSPRC